MFGVGLRSEHFPFLETNPKIQVDWFEIITENFLETEGRPIEILEKLRQDFPIGFHGVSLSIASHQELDWSYLKHVKKLIKRIDPFIVSDHLCWTGTEDNNLHNLLPFVYDETHLEKIACKVDQVQNFLERQICLENLSAYIRYKASCMNEWEFMRELEHRTGCGILLDINNLYVNAFNQHFDPDTFLDCIPEHAVKEMHLAGFSDRGNFLFDTHSQPVYPQVWQLYRKAIQKFKQVPTLVEWDEDIPDFERLEEEMLQAKAIWMSQHGHVSTTFCH